MDIRRATREERSRIDALLEAAGLPALPPGAALSNVLVGLEGGRIAGVAALDYRGRTGLVVRLAAAPDAPAPAELLASLLYSLVSRAQELGLRDLYALPGHDEAARSALAGLGFAPAAEAPHEIVRLCALAGCAPTSEGAGLLHLELATRV